MKVALSSVGQPKASKAAITIDSDDLTDREFKFFKDFIYREAGITLADHKKSLVTSRLAKRLRAHQFQNYTQYIKYLKSGDGALELETVVNLLTTNETYFFRESAHFDYLRDTILPKKQPGKFRLWCGASSSGEEVYSIAMTIAEELNNSQWEVMGSDINTEVIETAAAGHYAMHRIEGIPQNFLKKYCLKGTGKHTGSLLVNKELRKQVSFQQVNLIEDLPDIGMYDVIFLRNVMIYFDNETKRAILKRVLQKLKPGGYFFVAHSESIKTLVEGVSSVAPAVYQKDL